MRILFVLVVLATVANAEVFVPDLPDSFKAKVTAELPFVGKVSGVQYYDYPNNRNRIDLTIFGEPSVTLELYGNSIKYQIDGGKCESEELTQEMGPMTLPPFSVYQGNTTIGSVPVEIWFCDFGIAEITWFIDARDLRNAVIKRYEIKSIIDSAFDYEDVQAGPQPDSLFDPAQFGCLPPVPPVTYTVAGYVTSAVTGRVIKGATVTLGDKEATTNDQGTYSFEGVEEALVEIKVTASGYYSETKTVTVERDIPRGSSADFALSAELQKSEWRVVLTWAQFPQDLDSHMYSPDGCETFFSRRRCTGSGGTSSLDRDATKGYGPETITTTYSTGTFTHFVYIYSSGTFPASAATVKLYNHNGLVETMNVPTSGYDASSRYWSTFTINSPTEYTVVNKVTTQKPKPL